jgi:DsbC/DsbD-like thiol-disulfide interchange protein
MLLVLAIKRLCSAIAVLLLLRSATAIAQQGPNQHAKVELIARQVAVTPGKDLQLGVHFILEKGWHIYWINPGDSGQPPSFKCQLPPGFSAGEIQWPRPERLRPSKELVDYGYDDEVLLPITIRTPPAIGDRSAEFGAEAKWLICREVCLPEHASLHLTLPVSSAADVGQQHAELFAKTNKLIPQTLPRAWNASITSSKDDFIVTIRADKAVNKAEFFPLDPGQIDNAAPQKVQPTSKGAKITLKKSDLLVKPITFLRGVLAIPGSPPYRIEAPVRQPIQ